MLQSSSFSYLPAAKKLIFVPLAKMRKERGGSYKRRDVFNGKAWDDQRNE